MCANCGYKASDPSTLSRHNKLYHKGKQYSCADCEFLATRMIDLKKHKLKEHRRVKRVETFPCLHCDFVFTRNSSLKRHIELKHEDKSYPCDKCSDLDNMKMGDTQCVCLEPDSVNQEKSKEDIYLCYYCDFSAIKNSQVKYHMDNAHSKPSTGENGDMVLYPCDKCNYEATQNNHLKRHWISKHGVTKLKCDFCIKTFSLEVSLKQHIKRIHEKKLIPEVLSSLKAEI